MADNYLKTMGYPVLFTADEDHYNVLRDFEKTEEDFQRSYRDLTVNKLFNQNSDLNRIKNDNNRDY